MRLVAVLLASVMLALTPSMAAEQDLMQQPQTKEQAAEAQKQAEQSDSSSSSGGNGTIIGLLVIGGAIIVLAAWFIMRDSSDSITERERSAPRRPVERDTVGRGAPKAMFTGEGEPGGKVGKQKKRQQTRRQKQARKANRPR